MGLFLAWPTQPLTKTDTAVSNYQTNRREAPIGRWLPCPMNELVAFVAMAISTPHSTTTTPTTTTTTAAATTDISTQSARARRLWVWGYDAAKGNHWQDTCEVGRGLNTELELGLGLEIEMDWDRDRDGKES